MQYHFTMWYEIYKKCEKNLLKNYVPILTYELKNSDAIKSWKPCKLCLIKMYNTHWNNSVKLIDDLV